MKLGTIDEQLFRAFHDCLRLWFRLSITSGTDVEDYIWGSPASEFKNWILCKKLKLGYRENGCPFCSEFFDTINCPMGECSPFIDSYGIVACLSNTVVSNVMESLRADALVKLSEEYEKNLNDIMDDVIFIKRIRYNKLLPDSVRKVFRPPKPVSFEVDHKLAIVNGGDEWDMDNLQILCVDCHRKKTKLDMKISKFGDNNGT